MEVVCAITKKNYELSSCNRLDEIALPIKDLIIKDYPNLIYSDTISLEQITIYRKKYLNNLIEIERREINTLEKKVIDAISKNEKLSENTEEDFNVSLKLGEKMADKIAEFGGSWLFISAFFLFILIWILINVIAISSSFFDPYPFILLNLILSCLAAIQAPIIMMSQNRKEQKDRKRSENDYKINLKAELEIQLLHEKLDYLMINQSKKLLEIQQIQLDFFEDAFKKINTKN
ncbi:MAG: DUF1003 domain-containing protein [Bacteroidota bacterium]|nr:DUF1003 domain-containing protein [Bacteroidota bacterium]MDP3145804.1 DUF1003 domain-containing protein [Bacteroidota bacterium]MDP3558438.1 DUF1003 domain-containing protein [Bacteroidota bacterium]